jgi:hypothetical protein
LPACAKQVTGLEAAQGRKEEAGQRHCRLSGVAQALVPQAPAAGATAESLAFAKGESPDGQRGHTRVRAAWSGLVRLVASLLARGRKCADIWELLLPASTPSLVGLIAVNLPSRDDGRCDLFRRLLRTTAPTTTVEPAQGSCGGSTPLDVTVCVTWDSRLMEVLPPRDCPPSDPLAVALLPLLLLSALLSHGRGRAGEQTRTMTRFPSAGFCSFLQQTMPGAVVHSRALHIRRGSLAVRERITFSSVALKPCVVEEPHPNPLRQVRSVLPNGG